MWCGPPSTRADFSVTPVCAPIGRTSAPPRPAATARSRKSSARGCACPRCGSSAAARSMLRLKRANVRTPDERRGDLGAQLAATLRATERLKALARRSGPAEVIWYMTLVMDYSHRLMRAALADLPDGEGVFEDFCDGDGIADDELGKDAPFRISLSVKKT